MITFKDLISELQKLAKQKSQADANRERRERKRKDPGGQKKAILNRKYRKSAAGKKNARLAQKAAMRGKTATGRDMMTRNVSGEGGRERLQQKKQKQ